MILGIYLFYLQHFALVLLPVRVRLFLSLFFIAFFLYLFVGLSLEVCCDAFGIRLPLAESVCVCLRRSCSKYCSKVAAAALM